MRLLTLATLTLSLVAGGCSAARPAAVEVGDPAPFGLRFDRAGWVVLEAPAYVAVVEMTAEGARLLFPRDSSDVEAFDAGRSRLEVGPLMTGTRTSHWLCERPGEQFTGIATPQNVPPGSEVREVRRRGYHGYCFRPPGYSLGSAVSPPLQILFLASRTPLTRQLLDPRLERFEPGPWSTREQRLRQLQQAIGLAGAWGGYYYEFVR